VVTISSSDGVVASSGSGEILRGSGEILTNNHVVSLSANGGPLNVMFGDGNTAPAVIVGRDPQTDLAVIKVDAGRPLPAITMGSSSAVQLGQPVIVLGAPLGLAGSVSSGIVSALGRTVQVPADNGVTAVLLSSLQTDAAINPGNSGGALVDCSGALIGVPSANATVTDASGESSVGSTGIGFAIPVDLASLVADELISSGSVTHSYLGLQVVEIPPSPTGDPSQPTGVYVSVVDPAGPAALAGLVVGDIITAVDGKPVTDADQLAVLTLTKKPGETTSVSYLRAGAPTDAVITLGAQPTG
jgi:putative serine protease PepD